MSGTRNRYPFTPSQWQELEHQALVFKYMASGIPIPPDLLFTIKRSYYDSPTKLFSHQHQPIGWNCFQIGLGRKIDPEPGRCRRTDGKKWRCSKEAYPDSKYCERHMHRGKNRSRKPVEVATATPTPPIKTLTSDTNNSLHYSAYHHPQSHFLNLNNASNLLLDSAGSCSQTNTDYRNRYVYGLKEEESDEHEHAFFSEPSGNMRNFSGSSLDDSSWQLTPLTMSSSSSSSSSKQRTCSALQSDYSYLQLQSLTDHNTPNQDKDHPEGPQKTVHRFFDEWPPKTRESSWLDIDDNKSTNTSTTRLSISIPSAHDFPLFTSRNP